MSLDLPASIARYLAADKRSDPASIAACFTPDAVVTDEGNTHAGRDAIRQWMTNASTQYQYTAQPLSLAHEAGQIVVTSRLVGNFPGSPVDLRYLFSIEGDLIAALEIVP